MSTQPATQKAAASTLIQIARLDELRGDGPHSVSADGVDLVVARTPSGWRAFEGRCPHQGALLGEGELDGETLVCRNHRWRFGLADGQRQGGPQCLASCAVVEQDGGLAVDPASLPRDKAKARGTRAIKDLPGPSGLPLLGNLFQLDLSQIHVTLEGWAAKFGPLYRFSMGPQPVVAITVPELTEKVLRGRPDTFRRVANVEPIFKEMGLAGVFSAEGPAWRSQRRLAMEALSHRHLRGFYPTLVTVAERLYRRWEREAESGEPIDIVDDLKRFTVDTTTLLTFGHDAGTLDKGEDVIQRQLSLIFPALNRRLFALLPTWRLLRMPKDRRVDRAIAELRAWLTELVTATRARLAADPSLAERPSNFLESMLASRDDAGEPFPDDVIFGNLFTMLLAGEDTTAYTLGWAIHHLCDSPASVTALRREVDAVPGGGIVPAEIEIADKLTYATATANETMRLRPIAPLMFFETIVDTVLGDLHVPAQTRLACLTRPPVLDEKNFADPNEFRPERWLPGAAGPHEPSLHLPFGSGPRICPGRSLALLEMKVVLAMLYRGFDVERVGASSDVSEFFSFTMDPVGLKVRLRRRS